SKIEPYGIRDPILPPATNVCAPARQRPHIFPILRLLPSDPLPRLVPRTALEYGRWLGRCRLRMWPNGRREPGGRCAPSPHMLTSAVASAAAVPLDNRRRIGEVAAALSMRGRSRGPGKGPGVGGRPPQSTRFLSQVPPRAPPSHRLSGLSRPPSFPVLVKESTA